jgi:8-amino-7-oxononanoate synthase
LQRIEDDPSLRSRLWANARRLHEGLAGIGLEPYSPVSPVIAVKLPNELAAARAWNLLREHGVYVNLALPPGTPNSLCLLRASLSTAHDFAQIDAIVERFAAVMRKLEAAPVPA